MPKSIDYKVTLYPAHREGGFVVTKYNLFGDTKYPEKDIMAAGMPDLVSRVTAFANEHAEGCRASVRCLAARKPPGFKAATESLTFNLVENPKAPHRLPKGHVTPFLQKPVEILGGFSRS